MARNVKHVQNIGGEINGNSGPHGTVKHEIGFHCNIQRHLTDKLRPGVVYKQRVFVFLRHIWGGVVS